MPLTFFGFLNKSPGKRVDELLEKIQHLQGQPGTVPGEAAAGAQTSTPINQQMELLKAQKELDKLLQQELKNFMKKVNKGLRYSLSRISEDILRELMILLLATNHNLTDELRPKVNMILVNPTFVLALNESNLNKATKDKLWAIVEKAYDDKDLIQIFASHNKKLGEIDGMQMSETSNTFNLTNTNIRDMLNLNIPEKIKSAIRRFADATEPAKPAKPTKPAKS